MNKRSSASVFDVGLKLPSNQGAAGVGESFTSGVGHRLTQRLKQSVRRGQRLALLPGMLLTKREAFSCPICSYTGPFIDVGPTFSRMLNEQCLWCGALGRQRLQYCALEDFFLTYDCRVRSALHFAPERQISQYLRHRFAIYHTADLDPRGVEFQADLRNLPFADQSYDFLFASHVLEHIDDDQRALSEIRRVLRPGGCRDPPGTDYRREDRRISESHPCRGIPCAGARR